MPVGYHFSADTLRDGSPIPPIGEKLVFEGEIKICFSGLHWSERPFDALRYAPGKWLHLVECSDPVESQEDKHVSRERTILKTIDSEYLCRRFAADQALSVAHLWDMPGVVREYLTTLDESKSDAAWDAAREAAWKAASGTAWDAACRAAWDATCSGALVAARVAARAAAGTAREAALVAAREDARDASWAAAWEVQRNIFEDLVETAFGERMKRDQELTSPYGDNNHPLPPTK